MQEKITFLGELANEQFTAWQNQKPDDFYLNVKGKSEAIIHKADCWHLGTDGKLNAAKNLKICSSGFEEIKEYSEQNYPNYKTCSDCIK
ncbi:MAG TPA: hypothetical protein PKE69_25695 [Pyrinomonadaceae bacterium]|nr:hypothetical protein [Pyrinomonadaceae bacterium]